MFSSHCCWACSTRGVVVYFCCEVGQQWPQGLACLRTRSYFSVRGRFLRVAAHATALCTSQPSVKWPINSSNLVSNCQASPTKAGSCSLQQLSFCARMKARPLWKPRHNDSPQASYRALSGQCIRLVCNGLRQTCVARHGFAILRRGLLRLD